MIRPFIPAVLLPLMSAQAAEPVDMSSLDGLVKALYSTISGPKGQMRDPELQRKLFVPGARLVATRKRPDGSVAMVNMSLEDYMARAFPQMEARGFFEREIGRRVEQWGRVAQVWSAYESFESLQDPRPFDRGINTISLVNDGARWWVAGIAWDDEEAGKPLPSFAH